jgi:hypothetical protein
MNTNRPKSGKTTYHRDGSITIWDVYQQRWTRTMMLSDELWASLSEGERIKISRHTNR